MTTTPEERRVRIVLYGFQVPAPADPLDSEFFYTGVLHDDDGEMESIYAYDREIVSVEYLDEPVPEKE